MNCASMAEVLPPRVDEEGGPHCSNPKCIRLFICPRF